MSSGPFPALRSGAEIKVVTRKKRRHHDGARCLVVQHQPRNRCPTFPRVGSVGAHHPRRHGRSRRKVRPEAGLLERRTVVVLTMGLAVVRPLYRRV
jgi:hypothetical protein